LTNSCEELILWLKDFFKKGLEGSKVRKWKKTNEEKLKHLEEICEE
jgi:hypothetical protein